MASILSRNRPRAEIWLRPALTAAAKGRLAAMAAFAALTFAAAPAPGQAQVICTEPLTPSCLRDGANFDSETVRKRCITDIEAYMARIDEYVECNRQKIEEMLTAKEDAQERLKNLKAETR